MISNPPCPYLPHPDGPMSWRSFKACGTERGPNFYWVALAYGQYLWLQGLAARSILAVDRALFAHLAGDEPILQLWPLPYAAIAWIIDHNDPAVFIGNPRVHYQHLADRVRGHLYEQKKWRAWACWYLTRIIKPELERDTKHEVKEPTLEAIQNGLSQHGIPGEVDVFLKLL